MYITLHLAETNSAFRGSSDKLFTPNNGKFLGLVQLLAKFDPVMEHHLALAISGDITFHYCGENIQNELISLMAEKVDVAITEKGSLANFFSITADCTPDISKKEQLSILARIVDISGPEVEIKEYLLGFINITDSTGIGLTEVIVDVVERHGFKMSNCRGQGYDNGANMKGKKSGVQKRIPDISPRAPYVPCGSHSLNLVLCDAAQSSVKSVTMFGILQRLFTLFSASTQRWEILLDHVKMLTLRCLSDTRWEAKVNSVKAVRYQIAEVHDALITLAEIADQKEISIQTHIMSREYAKPPSDLLIKIVVLVLFVTGHNAHDTRNQKVCTSEVCRRTASLILANMDKNVDPCTDFYKFACGNYLSEELIPAHRLRVNPVSKMQDEIRNKLKGSLEKLRMSTDPDFLRKFTSFYETCMDEDRIEKNSRQDLLEELKKLGGWPLMDKKWNKDNFEWKKMTYRFRNAGFSYDMIINLKYESSKKNSKKYYLILERPKSALRAETLAKGTLDKRVKAYLQYKIGLAEYLGADPQRAQIELTDVLKFEIKIAMLLDEHEKNLKKSNRPQSEVTDILSLQRQCPQIPWASYLTKVLGLPNEPHPSMALITRIPGFLSTLCNVLSQTPPKILANYMFWSIAEEMVGTLGSTARQIRHEFFTVLSSGTFPSEAKRWSLCVDHVREHMPLAAAAVFVGDGHFDRNTKSKTMQIIHYIRASFRQTLEKIAWMDQNTKRAAIDKLNAMKSFVAYPDELLEYERLNTFYRDLKIYPESFLRSQLAFDRFHFQIQNKKYRGMIKKTDWSADFGDATDVNAIYSVGDNSFMIHAGILQEVYFNSENPKYINFAGIGNIIGHEIMHAFDNNGHKFDEEGKEKNWWSSQTEEIFNKNAQCFVDQYNSLMTSEDIAESSSSALGENIADNEGLRQAYQAYERWFQENHNPRVNDEEPRLPGLELRSPKQVFWLSFANSHCVRYRRPVKHAPFSPHAPHRLRVLGPLMNLNEFSKDFGCPIGSPMNPVKKCRIW
ncbi:hypothetical protein QAD02_006094 [Eretmocerus hayati]|uniref:Uncharacterized protein n=1 Tax=Eretmocerus hayati TaxID=131215 RepID=A0ACC2N0C1_9HYME|nr:hypothetical protein QAD02_006094 [Eretmocerus hayati]